MPFGRLRFGDTAEPDLTLVSAMSGTSVLRCRNRALPTGRKRAYRRFPHVTDLMGNEPAGWEGGLAVPASRRGGQVQSFHRLALLAREARPECRDPARVENLRLGTGRRQRQSRPEIPPTIDGRGLPS